MAHAPLHSAADAGVGVKLLLAGVGVIVVAQLWPAVPMAGAIAVVAWGTALNVAQRSGLLVVAALVYAPLGVLAVMAQVDLAMRSSPAWAALAGLDAAAAMVLLYYLARRTGELLARG